MQLAASQRAHPPPVPPRPSRQLVAEALKKSPRPPCPTRQAPPPPNQRPWRLEEHPRQQPQQPPPPAPQEAPLPASGRTVVYESPQAVRQEQPGKEEKRRSREAKSLNGREQKVLEETRPSAEAAGRRDEESKLVNGHKGSDNAGTEPSNGIEGDTCDGPKRGEARPAENSAERRRKKPPLNVSFKDEDQPDKPSGGGKPGSGTKIERQPAGATVVVIDEAESPRAGSAGGPGDEPVNIKRQDWLEAGVRYSSTKITLPADSPGSNGSEEVIVVNGCASHDRPLHAASTEQQQEMEEEEEEEEKEAQSQLEFGDLDFSSIIERIAMSSLQGLPPLPRSLSGFNLNGAGLAPSPTESSAPPPPPARSTSKAQQRSSSKTPSSTSSLSSQGSARPSPPGRQLTTLDTQLAILRREMFGLRQLDLSLLSQLWSLNESIQEFRQLLQEQEDRAPSPSPSSEEGDDTSYSSAHPPPPPRRPAPTTPHRHQQHHHYRSSRSSSSRSSKLPPSDESPSSEEYGAV